MKVRVQLMIWIPIVVVAFLAGSWVTFYGTRPAAAPERKILHYVDPMNPGVKFDGPGIAPCGMPREPVYADQLDSDGGTVPLASLPPGTIRILPEKQQLIGVKTMTVEKKPWTHTLRVLGRVVPDETLVYDINAATEGWIEETQPVTTGSQVKKNELLATLSFFSLEYRTLVQNYFNLVNLGDVADQDLSPLVNNPQYSEAQLRLMRKAARFAGPIADSAQIEYYRKSLYDYGITPYQLKEMERTRLFPEVIEVRAPAAGFILFRKVSPGLRLARGEQIFRIADLTRVWILADIFENEASVFKPGMLVEVEDPYRKRDFEGRISPVLPQFNAATRTLQMRVVVDNPDFVLRPDMFVNLEIPMGGPAAIVVPVDAVLDSGLKKTVFVAREGGYFEPRSVETGRHLGERVEIVGGLMAGEEIVISGNFLIDSEARIRQAASGIMGRIGRDPVCGMNIDEDRARADGLFLDHQGKTYYFCETQCLEDFRKEPERYLKASRAENMTMTEPSQAHLAHEGMAMPAAGDPAAMSAMPAAPSAVKADSGTGKMPMVEPAPAHEGMAMPAAGDPAAMSAMPAVPSAAKADPGTGKMPMVEPAPAHEGMKMPGSPAAEPLSVPPPGGPVSEMMPEAAAPSAPGLTAPRFNLPMQNDGSSEPASIRRQKIKRSALPAAADPDLNQRTPNPPGAGEMAMPGAPMSGPPAGGPTPDVMPGATAPSVPEIPASQVKPATQGSGWPERAPIRRPKVRSAVPPAAADPDPIRTAPNLPAAGESSLPGSPNAVPILESPDAAATPGLPASPSIPEVTPETIAPPISEPASIRRQNLKGPDPRTNLRSRRYGSPEAAPVRRPSIGDTASSVAGPTPSEGPVNEMNAELPDTVPTQEAESGTTPQTTPAVPR